MRFMREAWVLLSRGAGEVMNAGDESEGAVLSFGAGGGKKWGVGAVLARAAGVRLRWEAWIVFIWITGATLRGGAVFRCGTGGGEVTSEEVLT